MGWGQKAEKAGGRREAGDRPGAMGSGRGEQVAEETRTQEKKSRTMHTSPTGCPQDPPLLAPPPVLLPPLGQVGDSPVQGASGGSELARKKPTRQGQTGAAGLEAWLRAGHGEQRAFPAKAL